LILAAILVVFAGAFSSAKAAHHPLLNKTEADLLNASASDSPSDQTQDLTSALQHLSDPDTRSVKDQGHREKALTDIKTALADLKSNQGQDKINQDINAALEEVRAYIAILDAGSDQTEPPTTNAPAATTPPPVPPVTPPPVPVVNGPVAGQPWTNSLGVKFVPAGTDGVLFSVWDTRLKDFQAFVDATNYEATAGMYSMASDGWKQRGDTWKSPDFNQTDDDPVVGMIAADGTAFCQWLTKKEQAEGKLGPDQEYRLPTNAEWDAAAGSTTYPWGDDYPPPPGSGNYAGKEAQDGTWENGKPTLDGYDDGYPRTSPVGSFKPNAYGLYDVGGNVRQWCEDNDGSALRGAAWSQALSKELASSLKYRPKSYLRCSDFGFRIVLALSGQKDAASPKTAEKPTPAPPPAADRSAVTVALTTDQARAVVLITGDNSEGTGFLVKTPDGPVVVTNLHVISDNPNLKITTNTGQQITVLSLKGASDRDLAMFAIKDQNYSYLPLATDISGIAQPGDEVITPGNSEGGEVMLNTKGKLLGIGPVKIEFDNPIYHGNSGGPVLHTKSGQVLGVVTEAMKVIHSDDLDKTSFASRNSAISGSMRYFGLRIDTVPKWESYDLQRFENETAFLERFNHRSRCLDSYLNTPNDNQPDSILYREDADIVKANDTYIDQSSGGGSQQQMDALREWLFGLNGIADTDMDAIQQTNSFYTFDQQRARDEIAYRKALKKELDEIGNNVSRESSLPRKN
jgi:V8-like Glu-specific endopeptidase